MKLKRRKFIRVSATLKINGTVDSVSNVFKHGKKHRCQSKIGNSYHFTTIKNCLYICTKKKQCWKRHNRYKNTFHITIEWFTGSNLLEQPKPNCNDFLICLLILLIKYVDIHSNENKEYHKQICNPFATFTVYSLGYLSRGFLQRQKWIVIYFIKKFVKESQ